MSNKHPSEAKRNAHPHADLIKAWADDTSIELEYIALWWDKHNYKDCNINLVIESNPRHNFRIKEKPTEPFTLDWSVLDKRWKYAAVDADELIYAYERKPKYSHKEWKSHLVGDFLRIDSNLTCYTRGTVKPEDSLIKRPDDE